VKEDFKINGQYVNTPEQGVVGIPFFDSYVETAALAFLDEAAKSPDTPFFINVNFMKVHPPNLPAPEFEHKSLSKSKYADSVVELDARIGRIMNKLRSLGLEKNTAPEAAEHGIRRPDRALQVPEVPVDAGPAPEGRNQHPVADGQLARRLRGAGPGSESLRILPTVVPN
jgi:arylsulfatase A-like enzyme